MNKKKTKSPPALPADKVSPEVKPAQLAAPSTSTIVMTGPPPPEMLLELAESEPDRRLLGEYIDVIRTLRQDKRMSFREIAEWLAEHGVHADHNAVYREYGKWLSDPEGYEVEQQQEEMEQEEEEQRFRVK